MLEGFFNAIMDTLVHHYSTSIFKNWDSSFWNPSISWKRKLPHWVPDALSDGWHIMKLCHILSFLLAIVFYNPIWDTNLGLVTNIGFDFLTLGITRNLVFNLFYDKILIRGK